MTEATRREVIGTWRERKLDMVTHPLVNQSMRVGMLAHTQARILARVIRGDIEEYVPCSLK